MDNKINQAIIVGALTASLAGQPVEAALAANTVSQAGPAGAPAEVLATSTEHLISSQEQMEQFMQQPVLMVGQDKGAICGAVFTEVGGHPYLLVTPHILKTDSVWNIYTYNNDGTVVPMGISVEDIVHAYEAAHQNDPDYQASVDADLPIAIPLDALSPDQIHQLEQTFPAVAYDPFVLSKIQQIATAPGVTKVVLFTREMYSGKWKALELPIIYQATPPAVPADFSWPTDKGNGRQMFLQPVGELNPDGTLNPNAQTQFCYGQSSFAYFLGIEKDSKYYLVFAPDGTPIVTSEVSLVTDQNGNNVHLTDGKFDPMREGNPCFNTPGTTLRADSGLTYLPSGN